MMGKSSHKKGNVVPTEIPGPVFEQIEAAIESSRSLLDMHDNWDGEGSPGYTEATWKRAVRFISNSARQFWEYTGMLFPAPRILPGPNGSIDIHWDTEKYELLVNIPADPNIRAGFYGDDRGRLSIKGTLDADAENQGLLLWLKSLL